MAYIFTKKFRTLDPHPPIVQDFFLKKVDFFWTPPLNHGHAQPVAAGELLVGAAGQLEGDLVRGGKRARLRVVVDRPHVRPDQQRVQFCIRGREELFVLSIVCFPQG